MIVRTGLTADEIRKIFREELEDFKEELLEELGALPQNVPSEDPPVTTAEVCRRWGRSRTTLSKLIKNKSLVPMGRYKHSFTFKSSDIVKLFGMPIL